MTDNEIHLKLSDIKIDNDNLDYIKATGEICGKLRWDLVKLFNSSNDLSWKRVGEEIPSKEMHNKQLLAKIDYNCGFIIVRWNDYDHKFIPNSNEDYSESIKQLITGISHWCELK